MKARVATVTLALALMLFGLASCGKAENPVLQPVEWDFGEIPADSPVEQEVSVSNPGRRLLEVRFFSTCACLTIEPESVALPGRGQDSVLLRYDPSEDEGPVAMQVIVRSRRGKAASRQMLRVDGRVLPGAGTLPGMQSPAPRPSAQTAQLTFEYYYDPGCQGCEIFLVHKMIALQQELGIRLRVVRYDIGKPENQDKYMRRLEELGVEEKAYPAVVFADVVLQGDQQIDREFKQALQRHLESLGGDAIP